MIEVQALPVAEVDYKWPDDELVVRLSDYDALAAECERLRGEVSDLHTTMMAAAVEIQEHWDAHCDAEGYGPANLMHRLERGIASQYGYDAETVVRMEAQRDAALAELAALKGGQEAVAWAVCREPGKVDALSAAYASESAAKAHVNSYATKGCSGLHVTPLYTAPPAQASAWVQDSDIRSAAARAYGFLWHVNNEPGTPSPMYSAEKAAYRARIALRDMLTTEERGKAINAVGIEIGRYEQPAAPTPGASDGKGGDV